MTNGEYQELIAFLGKQFSAIDRRFDAIDSRLGAHDDRFETIDRHFEALDDRFDAIERRLDAHDEKFREILGHFDHLYRRLERLEQEYYAILQALQRIEALLTEERGKREFLERSVQDLKQHVATLQARIDELERRIQAS